MPSILQLERLLAIDPDDPFLLYGLAQEHAKLGQHGDAVRFYDRCLGADPAYLYAYFHQARSMAALGQRAQAAATLRTGLERARSAGDAKAAGEIEALIDELG